ncbi:adenine deaminase [Cytobacillus purgationiresistens]|uniref:Adenine deaminase n=1 Tax=Cytobacillus purgationiresistens TaxID=863449 RepID=A0ABU0AH33_9BACI|nr:adenine deaminase [Cytobacillus purgationiresistens]MDQ0270567.1 adenine deaminase [Cytobacillus purgationiresistens]
MDHIINRIHTASGKEPADLVIKNAKIVDVFSSEVITGDVAIKDGYFAGIGEYEGIETIDAKNKFLAPSFLDGHVHIESSMVTPPEFAKILLQHGITGVMCDPHEIANVVGAKGIQFMLDASEDIPFDAYFMLPSCVPSTPFENAGATLNADDLSPFYADKRVLGLAEVMNYPGVMNADQDLMAKIAEASKLGKKVDGHAAGLSGKQLDVYMAAGIRTDHECTTAEEARERLQKGMYVMIREGTAAKELDRIIKIVNDRNARRFLFVTDDRHLDDIIHEGSIDYMIRKAIKAGIDPITAIQMGSLNTAECFGLTEQGAVAPGYKADFILLDDLNELTIHSVFKNGECVVKNGELLNFPSFESAGKAEELKDSVHIPNLSKSDFNISIEDEQANIIEVIPNSIVTKHAVEAVNKNADHLFIPSVESDQLKIAVIERHHQTGNIGLGILKGLGLQSGAIATTVAHDSHNLIIAGVNDDDMIAAAKAVEEMQGGLVVVKNGEVLAKLSLPIAGLMSKASYSDVNHALESIDEALEELGAKSTFNPFLTLSFLALPVIPALKLTDIGLFDVSSFKHIPVTYQSDSL